MNTLKRRMEQLMNGRFEYEVPKLVFSDDKITVDINAGESYRGELLIGSEDHRRIKGMIVSSSRRVVLGKEKFSGIDISVPYGIDGEGLFPGDFEETFIVVNSNLGEYLIPVEITVRKPQIYTLVGEIDNLDDFTQLAENDYREAFRLFTKEVFVELLKGEDEKYKGLYQAMSQNPVTYQDMEEFLIGAGKKEPVHIQLEQEEMKYTYVCNSLKDSVYINKNNWGYVSVEIETKGDFLSVEKKLITVDDFIGSVCQLEYYINKEKLGIGKSYGQIVVHGVYETVVYHIIVSQSDEFTLTTYLYEKKMQAKLARYYQQHWLGKLSTEQWKHLSLDLLQQLSDSGCTYPKHRLWEAYIYYQAGEIARAMSALWTLREVNFTKEQMEEEGAYLLLASLLDEVTDALRPVIPNRVETLFHMCPNSFILAEVYLELVERAKNSPLKCLCLYEELFEKGCTSPFLYQATFDILCKDVNQLKKLSPFMIQVLSYAVKHGKMLIELAVRIGHLSEYVKVFQNNVYQLLTKCYECYPEKELLNYICKYIMKGQPRKKEYFRWYSQAVEQELRITRLYEYYIETMPDSYQNVLPQVIRMYFVYNNTLSSHTRAMVYANVIRNKEIDKNTYHSYRSAMEKFALESLKAGKINEDYATIYQECFEKLEGMEMAEQIANVMFTYRIFCDDPKIRSVIVCHEQLKQESVYTCKDGVAYIQLFTPDAEIVFEDGKRRRYAVTVDYNLQKLMNIKGYVEQCVSLQISHHGLILAVCEGKEGIQAEHLGCFQQAVQMEMFQESYRHQICKRMLEYYAKQETDETMDAYLCKFDYMDFAKVDKVLIVETLIDKLMYDAAFEIVKVYGYEGVRAEKLMKMVSRLILRTEFIEQEELVYLALHVFTQGFYDEIILTYLNDNFWGSLSQMVTLWERMKGFQMETYGLEEEIMLLAMFGRVYLPQGHAILKSYAQQGGKKQVILAYLSMWAFDYFLGEKETSSYIFECLEICMDRKWEMNQVCRLALLKYYAQGANLTEKQENYVRSILKECHEMGIRFAFFGKLPDKVTKPYQWDDKQFVEHKFSSAAKVSIHYQIENEDGIVSRRKSEPVKNMYQGIFVKEFLLFYGETLKYYWQVEIEKESYQTEERSLHMEESTQEGTSKYQLINQMVIGRKINQDTRTEKAMEQYLANECLVSKLFQLMK